MTTVLPEPAQPSGSQTGRSERIGMTGLASVPDPAGAPGRGLTPLVLGLLALVLVGPGLLPGRILAYGDWLTYYLPLRDHLASAWKAGEWLPLWWPQVLNGYPVGANPQYGLFYPPHLLLAVLPLGTALALLAGLHLFWGGLGMSVLLRGRGADPAAALLGGVVYLAAGPALAAASSVTLTLALAWLPWVLHLFPLGLEAGAVRPRLGAAVCLALMFLGGGLEVLLWTVLLLPFWTYASWRIYLGAGPGFGLQPPLARRLGPLVPGLVVVGGLALLLSGVQLLPFLELVGRSTRSAAMDPGLSRFTTEPGRLLAFLFPWAGWDPVSLTSWIEHTRQVRAHYLPSLFFGVTVLVLAVQGWRGSPVPERRVLGVVLLLALLFGLGSGLPGVGRLEDLVPGSGFYRYPEKYLLLTVPVLAWFSAWGLDRRLAFLRAPRLPGDTPVGPTGRPLLVVAGLAVLASLVLLLPGDGPARWLMGWQGLGSSASIRGPLDGYVLRQVAGLVLTAGVALAVRELLWPRADRGKKSGPPDQDGSLDRTRLAEVIPARWAPLAVSGLVALELLLTGWAFFGTAPLSLLREPMPLAESILLRSGVPIEVPDARRSRLAPPPDEGVPNTRTVRWTPFGQERAPARMFNRSQDQGLLYRSWLIPNLAVLQGVTTFDGLAALRVTEQALAENSWRTLPERARIPMARALGIRWLVVTDTDLVMRLMKVESVFHTSVDRSRPSGVLPAPTSVFLYDTQAPSPVRVVRDWETASDAAAAFARMRERASDLERLTILHPGVDGRSTEPSDLSGRPPREWTEGNPSNRVETLTATSDRLVFRVTSERPGLLLVAGTPYPGWRAEVNGSGQPVWTADLAFRAVPIPAGTSEVRLTFLPPSLLWGAAASLMGLLLLGLALVPWQRLGPRAEPLIP
jgi:hypothetical protein